MVVNCKEGRAFIYVDGKIVARPTPDTAVPPPQNPCPPHYQAPYISQEQHMALYLAFLEEGKLRKSALFTMSARLR